MTAGYMQPKTTKLVYGIATPNGIHVINHCIKQINDSVVTLVADKLKDSSNDRLILGINRH